MDTAVRIDKWLWAVRIFKTRSQAASACRASQVKIDGKTVKPSHTVTPGEVITARRGDFTRIVKVITLLDKRVGAKSVSDYMEDLTPPEPPMPKAQGKGRPTKRNRRIIERIMSEE